MLFGLVGVASFVHWVLADPSRDVSYSQSQWGHVLLFSAAIAILALALPSLGKQFDTVVIGRTSLAPAAGAALSSLANIAEDGLQWSWAFYAFVLGAATMLVGLSALAVTIVLPGVSRCRAMVLIPLATMAGMVFYVQAGGPILLATWLAATAVTAVTRHRPISGVSPVVR